MCMLLMANFNLEKLANGKFRVQNGKRGVPLEGLAHNF